MRNYLSPALAILLSTAAATAQINCRMLAHVDRFPGASAPTNNYAGIWGMVINGREYALVPARTGTVVYDCTDPRNPVEKGFIPGPGSGSTPYFWREVNSHGNYAYVSSEHGALQVINMTNPNSPSLAGTFGGSAHTVSIDQGARRLWANGGSGRGCRIYDLAASATNPPLRTTYNPAYCHDSLPIRGFAYLAHISSGSVRIVNTQAFPTIVSLSNTGTPGNFTHNVWVTDDDRVMVTADENRGGCLAIYDISDKSNPILRSTWCSPDGATVHNVFIKGQIAHFSSYSAGYYAVDISDPANPQLVCNFDTTTLSGSNYHGNWGCYPFQPSGVIYLTDMQTGFWIVEPTCGVPNHYGNGTAGSGGVPGLDYDGGYARVGNAGFQMVGTGAASAPAALILGAGPAQLPVFGIDVLVDLNLPFLILTGGTNASGSVTFPAPIPNAPISGSTLHAQLVVADAGGPQGLAASRGFKVTICP